MPARRQSGGPGPLHKVLASQPASLSVQNDYSFLFWRDSFLKFFLKKIKRKKKKEKVQ
jgi:hypothetical protein